MEDKTESGKGRGGKMGYWHGIQSKMKSFIYSNYYARANIDSKHNGRIEPQPTTAAAQFAFNNC